MDKKCQFKYCQLNRRDFGPHRGAEISQQLTGALHNYSGQSPGSGTFFGRSTIHFEKLLTKNMFLTPSLLR